MNLLTQREKDQMLFNTMRAQQMDLHTHQMNKVRYEQILATLDPEVMTGDGKNRITLKAKYEKLLSDTNDRIAEVQSIIDGTEAQLPTPEVLQVFLEEVEAEQDAEHNRKIAEARQLQLAVADLDAEILARESK